MKLIDKINNTKDTLFSIEILPPLKGHGINSVFSFIEPLVEFNPAFINVTYHREEYIYKEKDNGLLEKISVRKRPGTVALCAAISYKYRIDTVPHMICGGFATNETEDALLDLHFLGINNVLALRGDPLPNEKNFIPDPKGHKYAIDLVKQITNMNNGIYLYLEQKITEKTDFCIGVAGYPEKHFEAPNMDNDLKYLKMKIDAGAHYIVTQMFYDNEKFYKFVEKCRNNGINVPIIPGLKPLSRKSQLISLPKNFHIDIPQELVEEVEKCKTDEEAKRVGIEWCIKQSNELRKFGVPCLHYYTMGNSNAIIEIAKKVF